MDILDLRRVDEDAPMVCEVRHTPNGVEYTVQPGDITRYTVLVSGNVALAFVGLCADDYNVWLVRWGWNNYHPEKLNPYNLAVLAYFAAAALGQDVPEPDVLASRRKPSLCDEDHPVVAKIKRYRRGPYGSFPRTFVGKYALSVQASANHYCEPQQDLPTPGHYTQVEVFVYNQGNHDTPRWVGSSDAVYYSWARVAALIDRLERDDPPFASDEED